MAKTTTLHARIDSNLKENVEKILEQIGLTPTDAIKLFYKQVEIQGGLPFDLKLSKKLLAEKKLFEEIEKGYKSAKEHGWIPLEEIKKEFLG